MPSEQLDPLLLKTEGTDKRYEKSQSFKQPSNGFNLENYRLYVIIKKEKINKYNIF